MYDVSHESTSMYMEQIAELKTLGLRKHVHHVTRPLGCVPLGTMKQKTLRLCTPRHHETKDRWAGYSSVPKWDENRWWACIAWWWYMTCFMMISWLYISVCLWVWTEQNICIQLQLYCIDVLYGISCYTYQYTCEFEWNITYVYSYSLSAYDVL
jgi:hypothetical protein